jgi:hypothetical protein
MKDFDYKVYRCEWQIVSQPVGQYGEDREPSTVLTSWPTYEAAVIDRPTWAIEHEYVINRWIPKVKNDGYTVIEIRYCEVQVPYIPTK